VLDDRLVLELVAAEPDIVTPIGATFDSRGRLLVIESHTHFPPQDYAGPKSDRIRIIEDTDGDRRADRFRSFFEGTTATMSIERGPDDWIYVATRMEVFRIRDRDGDDRADQREDLVRLETSGNYPHNGLAGLMFDGQGRLWFGLGENLGEPYRIVDRGGVAFSGGGEGGNIYRCTADGRGLEHVATGFWNPFGICIDPHDRVFAVGNDPDASPPCRLVHVLDGGDYGYQFRYGRSGRHPLQAWNGELPGTLPMVAGTGEAPSAVQPYHGELWVTSWGDNRIERFSLRPHGASFQATREIAVQGDENFRPVDFAVAPDGSLYFTDWVDRSYPVHGKGRIWRLRWKADPGDSEPGFPAPTEEQRAATALHDRLDLDSLNSPDPFLHQAAVWALIRSGQFESLAWESLKNPRQRLGLLEASRWQSLDGAEPRIDWIGRGLADDDSDVRLYALRTIADFGLKQFRSEVERLLTDRATTPALFQATLATLEWLDHGKVTALKDASYEFYLVRALTDGARPAALRAMVLRLLPPEHDRLTIDLLQQFLADPEPELRREAVRSLALRGKNDKYQLLARVAEDTTVAEAVRADAVMGLADRAGEYRDLLNRLAKSDENSVADEARRGLQSESERMVADSSLPAADDVSGWLELLSRGGDADAGWRVFFGVRGGRCGSCHRYEGRGAAIGPDLTLVGKRMSAERLVQSILQPSREIAPQFVPWLLLTADGRVRTGLSQGVSEDGSRERFVDAEGKPFEVELSDIEERRASPKSIMPEDLEKTLTVQQLRDLFALLHGPSVSTD